MESRGRCRRLPPGTCPGGWGVQGGNAPLAGFGAEPRLAFVRRIALGRRARYHRQTSGARARPWFWMSRVRAHRLTRSASAKDPRHAHSVRSHEPSSAPRPPSRCWRAPRRSSAPGRSIINLGIGQPDFPTPAHIVEAGRKALADGHHGYTPANGILPLREAVAADLHRRHGVEVSPERVLVVPGGKVTMFFAIMMFGEEGAEIIYPNPGFPIYESVIRFSGATPVPMPLAREQGLLLQRRGGAGARLPRAPGC